MTSQDLIVHLNDLDLLLRETMDPVSRARLKKLGFGLEGIARLQAARNRTAAEAERRWMVIYERVRQRYGKAVAAVRDRVCLGCYVTLPTTARPRAVHEDPLSTCESCGRILYWG
ncbi:MAG TPA: C4-type zinc ribbon domain-containing protein [Candidatus Eisenbacteria bacterium]|jgi:predicted  nucleic acid-binding Zn-ribbon protein